MPDGMTRMSCRCSYSAEISPMVSKLLEILYVRVYIPTIILISGGLNGYCAGNASVPAECEPNRKYIKHSYHGIHHPYMDCLVVRVVHNATSEYPFRLVLRIQTVVAAAASLSSPSSGVS